MNNTPRMNEEQLMRKIQALSFAKVETALFLDTHPECKMALDYFHTVTEELDGAMSEYQNMYGPLFAEGASADRWNWTDGPWPWQMKGEVNMGRMPKCNGRK